MIGMDKTRFNYDQISKSNRDKELNEQWQKLNGNLSDKNSQDSSSQSKKSPLQEQQEKLAKMQATLKANAVKKANGVNSVNAVSAVNSVQEIDTDMAISQVQSFQNTGRFDIKQDIASFVRPNLVADNLKKENLNRTGIAVLERLSLSGASEALINRAKSLFSEEGSVKSVTEAYRNSLIFA